MSTTVHAYIASVTHGKERMTASEIATALVEYALDQIDVDRALYDESIAKPIMWRGATQFGRDHMKSARALQDVMNGEDEQGDLFDHEFGEFVWIGGEESTFVRRRALTRNEYAQGLALLEEHARRVAVKIDRYRTDYDFALPHWGPGVTFGEAYRLATEAGGRPTTT